MPVKILTLKDFTGGINSQDDPTAIKANEATNLVSLVPGRKGRLKMPGNFVNAGIGYDYDPDTDGENSPLGANSAIDMSVSTYNNSGWGLFYFNSEYEMAIASDVLVPNGEAYSIEGGIDYFVVQDNRYVKIYNSRSKMWVKSLVDIKGYDQTSNPPYVKPVYYFAADALRCTSAPVKGASTDVTYFKKRWVGHIRRNLFTYDDDSNASWINHNRWHIDDSEILPPSSASYSQQNRQLSETQLITLTKNWTFNAANDWVVLDDSGGDVVISTTGGYLQLVTTADDETEGIQLPVAQVSNAPVANVYYRIEVRLAMTVDNAGQVSTLNDKFYASFGGTNALLLRYDGLAKLWSNDLWDDKTTDYTAIIKAANTSGTLQVFTEGDTNIRNIRFKDIKVYELGSAPGKLSCDSITADTYDPTGNEGVKVTIKYNDTAVDGTWENIEYRFYATYIYDGCQESSATYIETITPDAQTHMRMSIAVDYSDDDDGAEDAGLNGVIFEEGIQINPRITGGRIYVSDEKDGFGVLYHMADFDFRRDKGTRKVGEEDWNSWDRDSAEEANHDLFVSPEISDEGLIVAGLSYADPPKFVTYETINGYKPFESLTASYETIAIVGKRAYIGNVTINGNTFNDRIMRSPVNFEGQPQYDTFPESHFLEIGSEDGDQIVALKSDADKLLVFKRASVSVVNVGRFGGEFVEHTFYFNGINHPTQVVKTEYGIVWVNKEGCHLYSKGQVNNLMKGKLLYGEPTEGYAPKMRWQIADHDMSNMPSIGYMPKDKKLIIPVNIHYDAANKKDCWIYSFESNTWSFNIGSFDLSKYTSNFINSRDGGLYCLGSAIDTDGSTVNHSGTDSSKQLYTWQPSPVGRAEVSYISPELNFGDASISKKIYKVSMTFKTATSTTNLKPYYARDGDDDISNTFVSNKGLLDGSGLLNPASTATQEVTDWTTNGFWSPYTGDAAKVTHLSQQLLSDSTFSSGWTVANQCSITGGLIRYNYNSEAVPTTGYAHYTIGTNAIQKGTLYNLQFTRTATVAYTVYDQTGTHTLAGGVSQSGSGTSSRDFSILASGPAAVDGFRILFTHTADADIDAVVVTAYPGFMSNLSNNSPFLTFGKFSGGIITHIAGFTSNELTPAAEVYNISFCIGIVDGSGAQLRLLDTGPSSAAIDVTAMATYDSNSGGSYPQSVPLRGLGAGEIASDSVEVKIPMTFYQLQSESVLNASNKYKLCFVINEESVTVTNTITLLALSMYDVSSWTTGLLEFSSPLSCKTFQFKLQGTGTSASPVEVPESFQLKDIQIYYKSLKPKLTTG